MEVANAYQLVNINTPVILKVQDVVESSYSYRPKWF